MRLIALLLLFLMGCKQSPYPIKAVATSFKGERPFLVELNTGQDMKPIPDGSIVTITGEIDERLHCWPVIYQNDTGFIYPKFLQ